MWVLFGALWSGVRTGGWIEREAGRARLYLVKGRSLCEREERLLCAGDVRGICSGTLRSLHLPSSRCGRACLVFFSRLCHGGVHARAGAVATAPVVAAAAAAATACPGLGMASRGAAAVEPPLLLFFWWQPDGRVPSREGGPDGPPHTGVAGVTDAVVRERRACGRGGGGCRRRGRPSRSGPEGRATRVA